MGDKPIGTRVTVVPLTIPNGAVPAFRDLLSPAYAAADHETVSNDLAMVSAPVVAAELRRIADRLSTQRQRNISSHEQGMYDARLQLADGLRARAFDLDGA